MIRYYWENELAGSFPSDMTIWLMNIPYLLFSKILPIEKSKKLFYFITPFCYALLYLEILFLNYILFCVLLKKDDPFFISNLIYCLMTAISFFRFPKWIDENMEEKK